MCRSRATRCTRIPLRICDNLYHSTVPTVIAVDNFLSERSRKGYILAIFHIDNIGNAVFFVKGANNRLFNLFHVELKRVYKGVVQMYLITHQAAYNFIAAKFFLKLAV